MWLFTVFLLGNLFQQVQQGSPHLQHNPVYRDLIEDGVNMTPQFDVKLPEPSLPDGLSGDEQKQRITKLIGRRYSWEVFTRDSTVAPYKFELTDKKTNDPNIKYQEAHIYFVAYGDLNAIADAGGVSESDDENAKSKPLTPNDLAANNIALVDPKHESYAYISNDLIDKIRLSGVLRSYWSETADSIIAAAEMDSRFDKNKKFPNQWQPLLTTRAPKKLGKASPYHGAGGYSKITRLEDPKEALFVEAHLVFAEPHGWFQGHNLLGAKLPAYFQSEVRSTRREILRATQKAKAK